MVMTPEDIGAEAFADALDPDALARNPTLTELYVQIEAAVHAAIRAAVAAEREGCATMIEARAARWPTGIAERRVLQEAAAAIRARGE